MEVEMQEASEFEAWTSSLWPAWKDLRDVFKPLFANLDFFFLKYLTKFMKLFAFSLPFCVLNVLSIFLLVFLFFLSSFSSCLIANQFILPTSVSSSICISRPKTIESIKLDF